MADLTDRLGEWWKQNIFRAEESERVIVTLFKDRAPDVEPFDNYISDEMWLTIPADINDIHIPRYFKDGKKTERVKIGYARLTTYWFGKQRGNGIIYKELEKIRGKKDETRQ